MDGNNPVELYELGPDGRPTPLSADRAAGVHAWMRLKRDARQQPVVPAEPDPYAHYSAGETAGAPILETSHYPSAQFSQFPTLPAQQAGAMGALLEALTAASRIDSGNASVRQLPPLMSQQPPRIPSDPFWSEDLLLGELAQPASETRSGLLDRFTTKQRVIGAAVLAIVASVGIGLAAKNDVSSQTAANTRESASPLPGTSGEIPVAGEYKPAALAPLSVATVATEITASSMWDFKPDGKFDPKTAIGVKSASDTSFDITASPDISFSVSAGFDVKSKTNAITDITKKGQKKTIQIDMSRLQVTPVVLPESIKDTKPVNFFTLPEESQIQALSQTLDALDVASTNIKSVYEQNKNNLEYQAIALGIQYALNQPEAKKQLIADTKTAITMKLGLGDPEKYAVTFIGEDKFAPAKNVADKFIKDNKISTEFARPVISKDRMPVISPPVFKDHKQV